MIGTLVNIATVLAGGAIGLALGKRLSQRYIDIVFQGIGLVTIGIGISMALESRNMIISAVSIISGSLIGQWLNIEKGLDKFAGRLKKSFKLSTDRFNVGFITASMLYCVGSMAILGSIEDGLGEFPRLLYTKSLMDGVAAIGFAATFGVGVLFSIIPIFLYQGTITLLASSIAQFMSESMIAEMTSVGGLMLIGLGITILKIKKVNVTNMLPALLVAILMAYLLERF